MKGERKVVEKKRKMEDGIRLCSVIVQVIVVFNSERLTF